MAAPLRSRSAPMAGSVPTSAEPTNGEIDPPAGDCLGPPGTHRFAHGPAWALSRLRLVHGPASRAGLGALAPAARSWAGLPGRPPYLGGYPKAPRRIAVATAAARSFTPSLR